MLILPLVIPFLALQVTQAPPVAPAPPAPPIGVIPNSGSVPGQIEVHIPLTAREIAAIRARRSELSNQLTSAQERRDNLAGQLEDATGTNRAGIEQRIQVLDSRIIQLEKDIAETGRQLTSADAGLAVGQVPRTPPLNDSDKAAIMGGLVTLFVLFPLAVAVARLIWRRGRAPTLPPGWTEAAQRLERLEQAMDTLAIEMERVSEGQRFTTKILTQRAGAQENGASAADPAPKALGAGPAEPVQINQLEQKQGVRVPRS